MALPTVLSVALDVECTQTVKATYLEPEDVQQALQYAAWLTEEKGEAVAGGFRPAWTSPPNGEVTGITQN